MKRKLSTKDLMTYFSVSEHCGTKIMVDRESLEKFTEITCPECDEPIMFRCSSGLWYMSGARVFQ